MQEKQASPPSTDLMTFCKNHEDIPSRYYATEQPWIKYCKECALNVALCGRNISQDFSTDEFERKMQIATTVLKLRNCTQQSEDNNSSYQKIITMLQQTSAPLNSRIADIDRSIKQLKQVRDKLQHLYEKELVEPMNSLLERRSHTALTCRYIKIQLESIQSNFSGFIMEQEKEKFRGQMEEWSQLINSSKRQLISEEEVNASRDRIAEVMDTVYQEIQKLGSFSVNIDTDAKQFQLPIEDTFSMVLTPIEANSLEASLSFDGTPFKKTKRELKLRSNRKTHQTDRELPSSKTTAQSKRASLCGIDRSAFMDLSGRFK